MSRNNRKSKQVLQENITKIKIPFNKTILFKVFSIIILLTLFLVPTLSLLINFINPSTNSTNVKTQSIRVKN
ncbi:MAG: hypothetical protein H7196_03690 [candidate division SR1 bacterium]|nr:hypothetical protein [candidate division SR1 bacterium]